MIAASMRPGQSCPGVVATGDEHDIRARIGFNEAGAIMPRSGTHSPSRMSGIARPASMRPGQSCPGVGQVGRQAYYYASIELQ